MDNTVKKKGMKNPILLKNFKDSLIIEADKAIYVPFLR